MELMAVPEACLSETSPELEPGLADDCGSGWRQITREYFDSLSATAA